MVAGCEDDITSQDGFVSGKFHRSLRPESRYNFINVAIWENEELYWRAYEKSVTPMKAALEHLDVERFRRSIRWHSNTDVALDLP